MKYFSTFSGIGGFESGIEKAIPKAECVGFSEIDKYAIQIYEKQFPNHKNYGDITKIDTATIPDFDCFVGGFPCQAFSIAGKRRGFNDTRGTLFFECARIIRDKRPRNFVLEIVKGLLSHVKGETFKTIIRTLDELGYFVEWQVLNSKNFGIPQNRERVFIVGHLGGIPRRKVFPIRETNNQTIRSIVKKSQCNHIFSENGVCPTISAGTHGYANGCVQLNKPKHSNDRVYSEEGLSPTLNTMQGGNRQPFVAMRWQRTEKGKQARRESQKRGRDYTPFNNGNRELVPVDGKPIGALTAQAIAKDSLIGNETKIRRLTPTECERLQGFPDGWTDIVSDTQRYKTLGNAVTVNVIEDIFKRLGFLHDKYINDDE